MKYMPLVKFEYRIKPWIFLLLPILCVLAYIFYQVAVDNDEGILLLKVIELNVKNTTIFYYGLASITLLMVLRLIQLFIRSFGVDKFIILKQEAITAPKVPNGKIQITINYADITSLRRAVINHQIYLNIKAPPNA